jgi:hypothetical protein
VKQRAGDQRFAHSGVCAGDENTVIRDSYPSRGY